MTCVFYVKPPKNWPKTSEHLEEHQGFRRQDYHENSVAFLYTSNEKSEFEIKNIPPFILALKQWTTE